MKKIENFLFLPVLVLVFYSMSKYSDAPIDVHFNDTYYMIPTAPLTGWLAVWLLLVFLLFKVIRRRQQSVHKKFAIVYLTGTVLFFAVFLLLGLSGDHSENGFSDSELDTLIFKDHVRVVAAWCFMATQVMFLIYFVMQFLKRPVALNKPSSNEKN